MFGEHREEHFANGYGVSIIPDRSEGFFELVVIKEDSAGRWPIVYDTTITENVESYQSADEITALIKRVEALERKES